MYHPHRLRFGMQSVGAGVCLGLLLSAPGLRAAPPQLASAVTAKTPGGLSPVDMAITWFSPERPAILSHIGDEAGPAAGDAIGPSQVWMLSPLDRTLSMALQRWSAAASWQLVWEADRDFPIEVEIQMEGHFSAVLSQVMDSLKDSDYPLQAVMNVRTRVLRIRRQNELRL